MKNKKRSKGIFYPHETSDFISHDKDSSCMIINAQYPKKLEHISTQKRVELEKME